MDFRVCLGHCEFVLQNYKMYPNCCRSRNSWTYHFDVLLHITFQLNSNQFVTRCNFPFAFTHPSNTCFVGGNRWSEHRFSMYPVCTLDFDFPIPVSILRRYASQRQQPKKSSPTFRQYIGRVELFIRHLAAVHFSIYTKYNPFAPYCLHNEILT